MKSPVIILCIICSMLLITAARAQQVKYVVLISIDGLRPDFYKEAGWPTPNLQQMKSSGVYADGVRGVYPTVTYPSHTTIITGALPAKHGIYYNEPFEPLGQTGRWYWETKLIKTPTLWDAVHKAGMTSAAVSWPVTVGAPIDYNVPEIWPLEKNGDKVQAIRNNTTPANLFDELEKNATGKLIINDFNSEYLTMDENIARIADYIIKTYKPNFTAVHFVCVDENEHAEGRDGPMVRKAVASADHCVGKILEALAIAGIKDSTAVIITGDHGFVNIHSAIAPNVWLAQNDLIEKKGTGRDYKAIFHTSGAAAFLHLKNNDDKETLEKVIKILDQLPQSRKKLFRIVNRAELDKIGADPDAALALNPIPGISMSSSFEGSDIKSVHGGTHGYFPDFKDVQTGFIGYGIAFNTGTVIPVMGLEDIAPVLSELLHLDFKAPDGILYPGILKNVSKEKH